MSTERPRAITVAALIEQLRQLPQDAEVGTEGCDCYGPCVGARIMFPKTRMQRPTVLLVRDDSACGFWTDDALAESR